MSTTAQRTWDTLSPQGDVSVMDSSARRNSFGKQVSRSFVFNSVFVSMPTRSVVCLGAAQNAVSMCIVSQVTMIVIPSQESRSTSSFDTTCDRHKHGELSYQHFSNWIESSRISETAHSPIVEAQIAAEYPYSHWSCPQQRSFEGVSHKAKYFEFRNIPTPAPLDHMHSSRMLYRITYGPLKRAVAVIPIVSRDNGTQVDSKATMGTILSVHPPHYELGYAVFQNIRIFGLPVARSRPNSKALALDRFQV
ncbi:hypothetical protein H4582DRAFT_2160400 [Lactarius indigo]|nr:hypothetical protein H4582DRAFT_2160400 [Lactarius indigo]